MGAAVEQRVTGGRWSRCRAMSRKAAWGSLSDSAPQGGPEIAVENYENTAEVKSIC